MKKLFKAFEFAFELEETKKLLSPKWKKENKGAPASTGFCYIAAEAINYILGSQGKPFCASYIEGGKKYTHWWIELNGDIIDPTATQYTKLGKKPPYNLGVGKGFLTKKLSKRANKLLKIVEIFYNIPG